MKLTAKAGKGEKIHLSLDGEYIATVNADYWFTCGIKSGSEVTPQQLEELLAESARRKMMNKALDLLSMRDYSRRELSDKLVTKAWEKKEQKDMDLGSLKQQASDICDRLEELGLLNEERFARSYVDELLRRKHLSKSGLKTALIQKGVQRDIIETVLEEVEVDPVEQVRELLATKFKNRDLSDEKQKTRTVNALLRLGYRYGEINAAMDGILEDE
ncbi:MAG: regulatory protein RecX [Clostridia bacterium]|nr:regulatory protein RecX [Clostridia bacterium]MBQ1313903.1 regulatory protein RecX [Clostridia bacterium]MBQ1530253.1 regulatory protein RecX [Clostridia bacterium]MBR1826130.1 regulatory protein RecX [Clostridia bacterium]